MKRVISLFFTMLIIISLTATPISASSLFAVDTLFKVELPFSEYVVPSDYFWQYGDFIYCVDVDNTISKIDIKNRKTETIAKSENLKFVENNDTFILSSLKQIYYDFKNETIVIYGYFTNNNTHSDVIYKEALLTVPGYKVLKSDNLGWLYGSIAKNYANIIGMTKNGNLIVNYTGGIYIHDSDYKVSTYLGRVDNAGIVHSAVEIDGKIYISSTNQLFVYDFKELKQKTFGGNDVASCVSNNHFYTCAPSACGKGTLDGKWYGTNEFDEVHVPLVRIKDSTPLLVGQPGMTPVISFKLVVTSDEEYVFYDIANKAFRIIYQD